MLSYGIIKKEDSMKNMNITNCPHCGGVKIIKYGKYNNIPRFKCKNCVRTFSMRTNSVWYYSKKKPEIWKSFCVLQMEGKTLDFCAKILKINIATAFYWRHKILNVLKILTEAESLSGHVFMQHYFIKESFKGAKNPPSGPRENLWMVFSYDSSDNSINVPYSRNRWHKNNFEELIYSKIKPGTYISAKGNNFIKVFARANNKRLKIPSDVYAFGRVEEILHTYRAIINRTRGVSTKYLNQYLALVKGYCLNKKINLESIFGNVLDKQIDKFNIDCHKIKRLKTLQI